jgi:flagellar basal-body rod protein FlgG
LIHRSHQRKTPPVIDSLYIGATGLHAQQLNVDTAANNLANVNTTGFKRSRVNFQDVMYRELQRAANSGSSPMGGGVGVASVNKLFNAGDLKKTDQPLDIAIRGEGFIEATTAEGLQVYTRTGRLTINKDGYLATADGHALKPSIAVPAESRSVEISASGIVMAVFGDTRKPEELGQLELAMFANPAGLVPMGENLYRSTEASGDASFGRPGEDGRGDLAQGYLEASNVRLVDAMVELMTAQRAYEVNAKVIQASDELLSMSNNLRR